MLVPAEVATLIVKTLDDKLAQDIKIIKTGELTVLADYFVICTASSAPHVKTLTETTEKALAEADEPVRRREGYRDGGWVLLDFGCVIVHIFLAEMRTFYGLEHLWSDAPIIPSETLLS